MEAPVGPGFGARSSRPDDAGPGQHGLGWPDPRVGPTEAKARVSGFCTCALRVLAEWFQSTRLETRTKESNMYASRWVANP